MPAESDPIPESRGALVPPVHHPSTAVATATPPPPPRLVRAQVERAPWLLRTLGGLVSAALDAADAVGDTIREAAGLGPGTTVTPGPRDRP